MKGITYSLELESGNSNLYYKKVNLIGNKIISNVINSGKVYIDDFMNFIEIENKEYLRSREEYGIEVLLIGVVLSEYLEYGRGFKNKSNIVFNFFNKLREKDIYKAKVDFIRGKLATKILLRRDNVNKKITFEDFKFIIKWMGATGDFTEEIYRLNNWIEFLKDKESNYIEDVFSFSINEAEYLYKEGKYHLGVYTKNVNSFLESYKEKHNEKEDIIYCGKGEIQYFFNMISAEVMNRIYRETYLKCKNKKAFIPACMRQTEKVCLSEKTNSGYKCKECSKDCNVRKLTDLGKEQGFKVYVIPHETMLFNMASEENKSIGIIGIACVINLISGGWKALRLGFKPQCVVLDYCGCSNHWLDSGVMTSINMEIIKKYEQLTKYSHL